MTQPQEPTPVEIVTGSEGAPTPPPPPAGGGQVNPAPAEIPAPKTPEDYEAIIKSLRSENAGWRTKMREAEPIVKAHTEAQEAAKTEVQRAQDRAATLETDLTATTNKLNVLQAAHRHGVLEEDFDLLGSGTPEELDARAARIAARYPSSTAATPPPSDRPVEGLRPGASPTPPAQPDNSYPESWRPAPPRGRT